MPLITVRENLLNMKVDAIVNPTNINLVTTGGIDKQIQDIEKEYFSNQAKNYKNLDVTDVIVFDSYKLDCKYIYNVIGPIYIDGNYNEEELLRLCYKNILNKALQENLDSIAIPILSSGAYSFPKDLAIKISKEEIELFLSNNELTVYVVVYDVESYTTSLKYYNVVEDYINKNEVVVENYFSVISKDVSIEEMIEKSVDISSIKDILSNKQATFASTLFNFIDSKKLKESDVYKKANISKQHFSKIRSNNNYSPSKQTVLAFCISLKLNLKESKELLDTAGFSLSKSLKADLIVECFIKNKIYNIYEINDILFTFNEKLLGQF